MAPKTMAGRMQREIQMLERDPPPGVCAWVKDGKLDELEAQIQGPEGSPYEKGIFKLSISIPERYPFEPPKVRFQTPIYHPNIDNAGRICLDTLKMRPKGSWLPSINLCTLLTTIRLLMAEPNPDDGLMPDITDLYRNDYNRFVEKAKDSTTQNAMENFQVETSVFKKPMSQEEEAKEKDVSSSESSSDSSDSSDEESKQPPKRRKIKDVAAL